MNVIQKSEAIKTGLRKGFQDGSSKMAKRKCYGYTINSDGELEINPDKAKVVSWIFERYMRPLFLMKYSRRHSKKNTAGIKNRKTTFPWSLHFNKMKKTTGGV